MLSVFLARICGNSSKQAIVFKGRPSKNKQGDKKIYLLYLFYLEVFHLYINSFDSGHKPL